MSWTEEVINPQFELRSTAQIIGCKYKNCGLLSCHTSHRFSMKVSVLLYKANRPHYSLSTPAQICSVSDEPLAKILTAILSFVMTFTNCIVFKCIYWQLLGRVLSNS